MVDPVEDYAFVTLTLWQLYGNDNSRLSMDDFTKITGGVRALEYFVTAWTRLLVSHILNL